MAMEVPANPAIERDDLEALEDEDDGTNYYQSIIKDQDDAEAVLQPAISAVASHLTSLNTPAIEKAAALEKRNTGGLFEIPSDGDGDASSEPDLSPGISPESKDQFQGGLRTNVPAIKVPSPQPRRDALPSPWQAGPKQHVDKDASSRPSKSVLGTAFGSTRTRSRSAGQEALKRIQKAFPSLSSPYHILPSLSGSFFSNSNDKTNPQRSSNPKSLSISLNKPQPSSSPSTPVSTQGPSRPPLATHDATLVRPASATPQRPPYLRRVTSDESVLYHTLSRASSLGADKEFPDVREMVNLRFMALKDSLPEVPNFKMPSLPKFYNQARKSTSSLSYTQSSEALGSQTLPRENSSSSKDASTALDRVLEQLTGDVVILGGYRGSILRSAEPPHQQVWAPVKLGLNMRKVNLEVGLEDEDEEKMENTIIPSGMLKHIGPIDISRKLIKKLRSCDNARSGKLRVWDYGYDWRLSPPLSSQRLQNFLSNLPSNKRGVPAEHRGALVIAHSLGGVITRHAVNQRPELFSGVLYAGVPQKCINILGPLRNGDVVLFNEKLLSTRVNFSMRTSFVFLPEDGFCFVDKNTGEEYPINFYDPQEWVKYSLSPCVNPALPAFNRPASNSLSSLIPNSLRPRSDSKADKGPPSPTGGKDRTIAPQMHPGTQQHNEDCPSEVERQKYLKYLARTLAMIHKFRSELAHSPTYQEANAYPPLAVLYGKNIPTVYAAQVNGREAISCADCYDDLLFRAGDGVVLAKEAMLPDGYSLVRGGRVCTERGHITMLGDLPAVGQALEALLRGRRKGIGLGIDNEENEK